MKLSFNRPQLKRFLTVFPLANGGWGIRGGDEDITQIRAKSEQASAAISEVLSLLTGQYDQTTLLNILQQRQIDPSTAIALLQHLDKCTLLEEGHSYSRASDLPNAHQNQLLFFSRFATDGGHAMQNKLNNAHVAIIYSHGVGTAMISLLQRSGIGSISVFCENQDDITTLQNTWPAQPDSDSLVTFYPLDRQQLFPNAFQSLPVQDQPNLLIVCRDAQDPALCETINQYALTHGLAWLLVQVDNHQLVCIGPLFLPGDSACYNCYQGRILANLQFPDEYRDFQNHLRQQQTTVQAVGLTAQFEMIAGVAVTETIKWLTQYNDANLVGRLLILDSDTWSSQIHDVLRLPHCQCRVTGPSHFPWKEANYAKRLGSQS
ncbi:TOMM precursor leader peptide-binding protein [Spartinivicinus poritis]|uniref:TOMM leader peptide-binding protein n=1 Tax=Spartinivicinus poritis TaxID=2994640 RepID=A0ABT5UHD5_9GAMM|nr:TOMM precursor leader peptide-binding protein [Spartinivicinus sp. A2-2]MDE1464848.1 TOMM precursor leader peptide-binding protein [Spartinivicinus sp. A2-2]